MTTTNEVELFARLIVRPRAAIDAVRLSASRSISMVSASGDLPMDVARRAD
jgi:hypothetical protein